MLLNTIDGAVPLHIAAVDGVAVMAGVGLTVTTALVVALQPLALPVMAYVAVADVLLLLLVKVWLMVDAVPELPPLIPLPCVTLQL